MPGGAVALEGAGLVEADSGAAPVIGEALVDVDAGGGRGHLVARVAGTDHARLVVPLRPVGTDLVTFYAVGLVQSS